MKFGFGATLMDILWQLCPQWWDEFNGELNWLFTCRHRDTRYTKVKRMGIREILRRIWLFSANKIKSSESISKQPIQLIVELNSSVLHIIVTFTYNMQWGLKWGLMWFQAKYKQKAFCVADLVSVHLKHSGHYNFMLEGKLVALKELKWEL